MPNSAEHLTTRLEEFSAHKEVNGNKGPIAALMVINRQALDRQTANALNWPLNAEDWKTGKQGQVKGLGGPATQKILLQYGIVRELASEGGRTSPRRPPKVLHLWPPKLLHPAWGDLMH